LGPSPRSGSGFSTHRGGPGAPYFVEHMMRLQTPPQLGIEHKSTAAVRCKGSR
jgi:hypothetical protein